MTATVDAKERELPPPAAARWIAAVLGGYALAGGVVSLYGWVSDTPRLTDWGATGISIQPNTAVAAAAAGAALVLLTMRRRGISAALGAIAMLLGAATLFQHLSGSSLGIDTILVDRSWGREATTSPGRMGPPAATCFTLLGLGLVLVAASARERARRAAGVLALAASSIALNPIIGYAFGADQLYAVARISAIALQTATILLALGLGVIAAMPERQPARSLWMDSGGGLLVRRALPFVIVLPVVLAWFRLEAQAAGLIDTGMGIALLLLTLIVLLCGVLWWGAAAVDARERALAAVDKVRLRAEMALREARDQFIVLDRDWRYVYVNERVSAISGVPREGLVGRSLWELWPEIIGTPLEAACRRVMEGRETESLEYHHDPWGRWFDARIYPATEGGIALFVLEITDRKRAEDALQRSEESLAAELAGMTRVHAAGSRLGGAPDLRSLAKEIVEAAGELVGTDVGALQLVNATTGRLETAVARGLSQRYLERWRLESSAWRRGERRLEERVVVEDVAIEPRLLAVERERLLEEGVRGVISTPLLGRGGDLLALLDNYFTEPHAPSERELRFLDLLARMSADSIERQRASAALEDADRRKSEFLALLAHELRNPLAVVTNALEVLGQAAGDTELIEQVRTTMKRQAAQMARLIDDLLDVSRVAQDKLELKKTRIDLRVVVHDAVEGCRQNFQSAGQQASVAMPEQPVEVEGDLVRLVQVFGNLLTNASRYSPPGTRIWVNVEERDGEALACVRDEGAGIPPDMLASVFDMFVQLDRPLERLQGGLGIGLTLVKQLVELHGGTVEASSDGEGRGSEFVVRFPALAAQPAAAAPRGAIEGTAPPARRRILVVDDNHDSAETLATWLSLTGHEVQTAHDGEQALDRLEVYRPDAIVLDIGLPGMDGYDVCRHIRRQPWGQTMMLIAFTGWGLDEDRRKSREAGFDAHLVKPVDHGALMDLLAGLATRDTLLPR